MRNVHKLVFMMYFSVFTTHWRLSFRFCGNPINYIPPYSIFKAMDMLDFWVFFYCILWVALFFFQ